MAETAAAEAPGTGITLKPERRIYRASGGRRTLFSFLILILLPFFASLPFMLMQRLAHGLVLDTVGLAIIGIAFAVIMLLLLIELLFSLRARVELGEDRVRMTLPSGRGPTPMLRYKSYDIPYDQVGTVETRREVYGGGLMPVQLQGARLMLKDGSIVRLGYVSEANVDPAFPYTEIAKKIAERARLPLIDRGSVRRTLKNKFLGIRQSGDSDLISEADIANLNHTHNNALLVLIGTFVVLIVIGIFEDLSTTLKPGPAITARPAPVSAPAVAPVKPKS